MEDIKEVVKAFFEPVLNAAIVRNSEDEKKEDKDEKEAKNEKVDKRDIIRQIMAIAGKEEASEDVKTIAKLAEKLAYDESEAGKADNKKAKNEDEEEEENEEFVEEKEVANKKAKNEEKEEDKEEDEEKEEVKNKCKNSMDEIKKAIYGGKANVTSGYITRAERLELGNKY